MTTTRVDPCFFVLGYGRSGTTLLRRMLSAHPELYVVPENDAFQRLPPVLRDHGIADPAQLDRAVATFPDWFGGVYDVPLFRERVTAAMPLSTPDVFLELLRSARIGAHKPGAVPGHKQPSEWPYIGTWREWWPQARFVHMVRQPHDSTASMVEYQLQRYRTTPLVAIWQWRKAFRAIRHHGAQLGPDQYLLVRYEDLVGDPGATLTRVSDFLGVPTDGVAAMLDYRNDTTASHVDQGEHMEQTHRDLTSERVGRARDGQTEEQMAMLDHVCRAELRELGYEPRASVPVTAARGRAYDAACAGLDVAWAGLRTTRRAKGQL